MEARIVVYMPDEISDEELARSNTIQKTVSSFGRTFTLTGRKKEKAAPAGGADKKDDEEEEDDEDDEEEETFNWVFIAFMSDGTLRQYANELMSEELARLKLGYLVQAEFLDDPCVARHARTTPHRAHTKKHLRCAHIAVRPSPSLMMLTPSTLPCPTLKPLLHSL
jgi:hypothetical protein